MALVRVPFYFINLCLTVTDSHFVHYYTTVAAGPETLGNPGWLDPMSARSNIGPGKTPPRTAAIVASVIRTNRDPGRLGIEPIPGIEATVMK